MPIILNENEWTETGDSVRISLRLPGVRTENLNIIQTDSYLKVQKSFEDKKKHKPMKLFLFL